MRKLWFSGAPRKGEECPDQGDSIRGGVSSREAKKRDEALNCKRILSRRKCPEDSGSKENPQISPKRVLNLKT